MRPCTNKTELVCTYMKSNGAANSQECNWNFMKLWNLNFGYQELSSYLYRTCSQTILGMTWTIPPQVQMLNIFSQVEDPVLGGVKTSQFETCLESDDWGHDSEGSIWSQVHFSVCPSCLPWDERVCHVILLLWCFESQSQWSQEVWTETSENLLLFPISRYLVTAMNGLDKKLLQPQFFFFWDKISLTQTGIPS